MSRKKTQPKKVVTPDPIFNSTIIPKLINSIMYDGKKVVAEKADFGIVVDPDVDRLAFVDENGAVFGEEYTWLF